MLTTFRTGHFKVKAVFLMKYGFLISHLLTLPYFDLTLSKLKYLKNIVLINI